MPKTFYNKFSYFVSFMFRSYVIYVSIFIFFLVNILWIQANNKNKSITKPITITLVNIDNDVVILQSTNSEENPLLHLILNYIS